MTRADPGGTALMARSSATDLAVFESHRALLVALAYRMLGDVGRAEDMVQEAWLRWQGRREEADSPRAYLVTVVTRLCLNELDSAKSRHEESRSDRLPEPVDLDEGGLGRLESLDQVSMAFLVVLQRLTPAERAVLLLYDVFDFAHDEIATLVGKSEAACRKLLERARQNVATEKRLFSTSEDAHRRLLGAFMQATYAGDVNALVAMLAEDAVLITDGGREGRSVGGLRNLRVPLHGAARIATFVVEATRRVAATLEVEERELNGQPAMVLHREGSPFAAILLGVADDRIHRVFFHADPERLRHLGPRHREGA
jgi:RNA polymerase sigma-70 factor, ECF subfamily